MVRSSAAQRAHEATVERGGGLKSEECMSDAQREARAKAIELLTEHFDSFVLLVESDTNDEQERQCTFFLGAFEGGCSAAVGLMERYKMLLLPVREPESS